MRIEGFLLRIIMIIFNFNDKLIVLFYFVHNVSFQLTINANFPC